MPAVVQVACPGEEAAAKLVEGDRHDPVRGQERLLHPVSMVDVYVDIQHPCMVLEQLQYCQDYVIHVAES